MVSNFSVPVCDGLWILWPDLWWSLPTPYIKIQTMIERLHIWLQTVGEKLQRLIDRGRQVPVKEFHRVSHFNPTGIALTSFFSFLFNWKKLLWQVDVTINPHNFVIATCIWSVKIIYLLVSCNKQFFSQRPRARQPACLCTFQPNDRRLSSNGPPRTNNFASSVALSKMAVTSLTSRIEKMAKSQQAKMEVIMSFIIFDWKKKK